MSYHLHHCCHRSRESSPSVSLAPKWLFLSHVSYISFEIRPMMHMAKCFILLTHPRTFRLPMDSTLQEEDAMWHINYSLCGPHSLHDPLPLQFSLVFIFLAPLLNIYAIIMFKHHSLSPLFQIPKLPPQPRKLVIFLHGNYLTLSINLTKSHEYGKCDYVIVTQWKIWDMT